MVYFYYNTKVKRYKLPDLITKHALYLIKTIYICYVMFIRKALTSSLKISPMSNARKTNKMSLAYLCYLTLFILPLEIASTGTMT